MLICSNQKKEFAFIRTPFNKLALPLVVVSQEHATYWAAIEKYCQDLGLKVNFQGICHMAIGNDGAFNFQRFVYYGTLR